MTWRCHRGWWKERNRGKLLLRGFSLSLIDIFSIHSTLDDEHASLLSTLLKIISIGISIETLRCDVDIQGPSFPRYVFKSSSSHTGIARICSCGFVLRFGLFLIFNHYQPSLIHSSCWWPMRPCNRKLYTAMRNRWVGFADRCGGISSLEVGVNGAEVRHSLFSGNIKGAASLPEGFESRLCGLRIWSCV